jgi:Protein of unknown function (DUF732)
MTTRPCYSNSLVGAGLRSLPKRALVVGGALTALATLAATMDVPADADTTSDAFLSALSSAGIDYGNPTDTVALGQSICPALVEPGKNFASVASSIRGNNNGISPAMASFFTGIAISMYCPSMINSIGDGTVLDQLNGLNGLGGLTGIPGLDGLGGLGGMQIPGLT